MSESSEKPSSSTEPKNEKISRVMNGVIERFDSLKDYIDELRRLREEQA